MIEDLASKIQIECKKHFKNTYSLVVPDDWLNQCIEFILEENQVKNTIKKSLFQ